MSLITDELREASPRRVGRWIESGTPRVYVSGFEGEVRVGVDLTLGEEGEDAKPPQIQELTGRARAGGPPGSSGGKPVFVPQPADPVWSQAVQSVHALSERRVLEAAAERDAVTSDEQVPTDEQLVKRDQGRK